MFRQLFPLHESISWYCAPAAVPAPVSAVSDDEEFENYIVKVKQEGIQKNKMQVQSRHFKLSYANLF